MKITSVNDSKLAWAENFVREYLIQLANILKEQNGKGSLVRVYLAHLQRKTTEMDQGNHNRRKQTSEPIKTHNKQSSKKCYLHWFDWTRNYSPQQTTFRSRSSATKTIPLEPSKLSYQLIENRHHKILVKFFNHTFSELTKSLGRSSSCEISISTSTLATKEPNRQRVNKSILELVRCKCFSSVFFFFFFFFF